MSGGHYSERLDSYGKTIFRPSGFDSVNRVNDVSEVAANPQKQH
jgi:hypothetical protein